LANILNGNSNPDPSTLKGLCSFFGVNQYYFDDVEPRTAELLGRVAKLDSSGHSAVTRLLDELDDLAGDPPQDTPGEGQGW
jgi:transcriptional regulator with XRE-family HTH domain